MLAVEGAQTHRHDDIVKVAGNISVLAVEIVRTHQGNDILQVVNNSRMLDVEGAPKHELEDIVSIWFEDIISRAQKHQFNDIISGAASSKSSNLLYTHISVLT